jgi:hypothetical protein
VASKSHAALAATPLTFSHRPTVRIEGDTVSYSAVCLSSFCSPLTHILSGSLPSEVPAHGHETYGVADGVYSTLE